MADMLFGHMFFFLQSQLCCFVYECVNGCLAFLMPVSVLPTSGSVQADPVGGVSVFSGG